MKEKIAELLLHIRAVSVNIEAPYHYRSGIVSPIYCDNRLIISYPKEREIVVNGMIDLIRGHDLTPDVIAGTATAAIPFAAWVADRLGLPMVYVRSGQKNYGKGRQIEGVLEKGARVVFTEDLITTGGGVISAVEEVEQAGGEVAGIIAVFEYGLRTADKAFKDKKLAKWTLSDFVTVLEVITGRGDLSKEEKAIALSWKADPKGWGSKMGYE